MRVTSRINLDVRTFSAGESTGFNLPISIKYYDYRNKKNEYANYSAVIFAKGNQANFYAENLVKGAVVEVYADAVIMREYESNGETKHTMELVNAKLMNVFTSGEAPPKAQPQQSQAPVNNDFDDDIPF